VCKSLHNPVMNKVTGFFYFLNFANKSTYLQSECVLIGGLWSFEKSPPIYFFCIVSTPFANS